MADQAPQATATTGPAHEEEHEGGHVVPAWALLAVGGALLFLTWITVAATYFDFGELNLAIALLIAVVKGSLVVLFFMHLYWDRPFNAVVFVSSLFFLALFIGIALLDRNQYQSSMDPALYEQTWNSNTDKETNQKRNPHLYDYKKKQQGTDGG